MQRDKKLGLALGVLLIGIVAAFFFRLDHRTTKRNRVPQLNNAQALDKQIADKPGAPYIDDTKNKPPAPEQKKVAEPPLWQMPEFLADGKSEMPEDWLAKNPTAPDPIPQQKPLGEEIAEADLDADEMFDSDEEPGKQVIAHTVSQSKPKNGEAKPNHNAAKPKNDDTKPKSPPDPKPESEIVHVVRSGDTLSKIAAQYLGSSAKFSEIYEHNKEVLSDANNLTVGTELRIPRRAQKTQPTKPNPVANNSDNRRKIDAQNASTGKVVAPNAPSNSKKTDGATEQKNGTPRRFVPVSRPPFTHGRRDNQSSENGIPSLKQTLSQAPPADLPDID